MGYQNIADYQNYWYNLFSPQNNQNHISPLPDHKQALKKYVFLGPRKHAKSEVFAINCLSWIISRFPELHALITSKTDTLATNTLKAVRRRIEFDKRHIEVFGNLKPDNPQQWNDNAFTLERKQISKFPTLSASGLYGSGNLTGQGFDLIICDDIIDVENVGTELQRNKAFDWFREALLPTMFSTGAIIVIGSRWHNNDLYSNLINPKSENGLGWPSQSLSAIKNSEAYFAGREPAQVLWPEVWPIEALLERKNDLGTIKFFNQYINQPLPATGDMLKAEWLHYWDTTQPNLSPYTPTDIKPYMAIDPAGGENDYFAIATGGYSAFQNRLYLYNVWAEHKDYFEILSAHLPNEFEKYNPLKMYVEANFMQKILIKHANFRTHPNGTTYPIVPVHTHTNKEIRFTVASAHFEAMRVLINPALRDSLFTQQWVSFPKDAHDDAVDAVVLLCENVFRGVRAPSSNVGGAENKLINKTAPNSYVSGS